MTGCRVNFSFTFTWNVGNVRILRRCLLALGFRIYGRSHKRLVADAHGVKKLCCPFHLQVGAATLHHCCD